tara:strand:+ start:420 stop:650 length:231 start_codon:yes stop_codon:yes gene_type:complete
MPTTSRTYTKDDVSYSVDKLSAEAQSIFNVLVAAKGNVEKASLELALARASVITLVDNLNKHLDDTALIADDVGHP